MAIFDQIETHEECNAKCGLVLFVCLKFCMGDGTVKYIDTKYRNDIIIAKMAKTFAKASVATMLIWIILLHMYV